MRRLAVLLAGALLVTGCSTGQDNPDGPLQVAETLEAATPAKAPDQTATPAGTLLALSGAASSTVVDPASRTLAVAVDQPPAVWLWSLDDLAAPPRSVPLSAPTAQLSLDTAANTVLAPLPSVNQLLRITPSTGTATSLAVDGGPVSAATVAGHTLVALRQHKAVAVFDGDQLARTVSGLTSADQVVANDRHAAMVDRLRTAVFTLDPASTSQGPGLRAGDGAANAVTDRFDRVLVTDARSGELLVFSLDPLLMRQRFPVPGTPYGIAYDPERDLAWVTLTERNEVVGYDVAGGEPVERYRFPTVTQPNSVTVDPASGRVFVASATGQGVQVVQP